MMKYKYTLVLEDLGVRIQVELEGGRLLYQSDIWATEEQAVKQAQKWVEEEWPKYRRGLPDGTITDGYDKLQVKLSKQEERHEPETAGNKD